MRGRWWVFVGTSRRLRSGRPLRTRGFDRLKPHRGCRGQRRGGACRFLPDLGPRRGPQPPNPRVSRSPPPERRRRA
eukprot:1570696-Pyramimonas_sp.AAC.1